MKRTVAIADRAAPVALKLIAVLNILFFLAFVATLLASVAQVQAAPADTISAALNGFAAIHP